MKSIKCYRYNIDTTLTLLEVMEDTVAITWCSVHRQLSTVKKYRFHIYNLWDVESAQIPMVGLKI